jgi:REP element-mobilizing transposase RayT
MPRRLRVHVDGGIYHVTLRGNHRGNLFVVPGDRAILNQIVKKALTKHELRLHAYCWMSNHIHLLVQVNTQPLSGAMRDIAAEFARAMQSRLATTGHFFERRYHAKLVGDDSYFMELIRYIHLNPVRAKVVDCSDDFEWSSHRVYLGERHEEWVTTEFGMRLFGSTPSSARAAYRAFLSSADGLEWVPPSAESGDRSWAAEKEDGLRGAHDLKGSNTAGKSLEQLILEACRRFEVDLALLCAPTRNRYASRVRAWIANQALKQHIATLSLVARVLGRNEATLREAIRKYPADVE